MQDFLTKKFNLPSKLFVTKQQLMQFMQGVQQQQQQQQQAQLPTPTTGASPVSIPQAQGVTI